MNIIDFIYNEEKKQAEKMRLTKELEFKYLTNQLKSLLKIAVEKKEYFEDYLKSFYSDFENLKENK
jgi:hypothetical protein